MKIWTRARNGWRAWRSRPGKTRQRSTAPGGDRHLDLARESLRELLDDARVPTEIRAQLEDDYQSVSAMLDKLEHGHLHVAVLGRVGVGKSSLLNALAGDAIFAVSALHGETRAPKRAAWKEAKHVGVHFIDTPGLDEIGGEDRERMAREAAGRADLVLFVVDGDMTRSEQEALRTLTAAGRPVLAILNKVDRYTAAERDSLLEALRGRLEGQLDAANLLPVSASPRPQTVLEQGPDGEVTERERERPPDIEGLQLRLWDVLEREGKTLSAVNAGLFAGELSDRVSERILAARQHLAERTVRVYCVSKGVAVALNPVPVTDLFAAALIDVGMVVHLSRIYGLPLTRREATRLIQVIMGQLVALSGTVWAVHLVSSALKAATAGLSIALTAGAQGAVAYYSTYVVGRVAQRYLAQGKAWGEGGPKRAVKSILESLDRDSILAQGRSQILQRLRGAGSAGG